MGTELFTLQDAAKAALHVRHAAGVVVAAGLATYMS
jgi:hypothetical protein